MKKYIICDATNLTALSAIKDVLSKVPGEFYFVPVACEECKNFQTIENNDGLEQIASVAELLFKSFKKDNPGVLAYVVDIKETIIFARSEKNPKLCCIASFFSEDMSKIINATIILDLPEKLQGQLVLKNDIYTAINLCCEEKIEGGACLYDYFFKKEKSRVYEEALSKLFFI